MEVLAKFDRNGCRETTVLEGVHYRDEASRENYIRQGYIAISEEDFTYYVGWRGAGDHGTGYIRDPQTGKPVSAPPVETTEEPTANVPETELAVMEGMVDMQSRIAALEAELAKLKGGK